jgi:ribosome-binding factor A
MKNKPDRITRVNELIKREIADLLERKEFSSNCLISVTEVKTSHDLRHAKIYFSFLGGDKEIHQNAMKFLKQNRVDLQKRMSHDVVLKYTPVLEFIFDKNYEEADRVLSLIDELDHEDE